MARSISARSHMNRNKSVWQALTSGCAAIQLGYRDNVYLSFKKRLDNWTRNTRAVQTTARCLATIGSRMRVAFAFLLAPLPFATLLLMSQACELLHFPEPRSHDGMRKNTQQKHKCTMQAVNSTNRTEGSDFVRSILLRLLLRWRGRALCAPDCGQLLCQPLLQRPLTPFSAWNGQ